MIAVVSPSRLHGAITAPPSKSMMQRVIAAALLSNGTTVIHNPDDSNDSLAAMQMAETLGADLFTDGETLEITGGKHLLDRTLQPGESGLGFRLFACVASLHDEPITLEATGSLVDRPMKWLEEHLPEHGVQVRSNAGRSPITITGPLQPGHFKVDGSTSSQFISGLLMVLPLLNGDSVVEVSGAVSTPYIDLTLEVMKAFGIEVEHDDHTEFRIRGNQRYEACEIRISGDWSAGATLLCAGAIAADGFLDVMGLDRTFTQADQQVCGALLFSGAGIMNIANGVRVLRKKRKGIQFDLTEAPDLFPVLAALGAEAQSPSTFSGIHRLTHKESDRCEAVISSFGKAGIRAERKEDTLIIHPGKIQPCVFDAFHDHRMAMAGALLGLQGGPIEILDAQCVSKSYPTFFEDLLHAGANVRFRKDRS